MEKEFVPYEQALALKELGFNEPCFGYFKDGEFRIPNPHEPFKNSELKSWFVTAPLFSQAFRFFREKQEIEGFVHKSIEGNYYFVIKRTGNNENNVYEFTKTAPKIFDTYEDAEVACLEKLIEIVELKQKEDANKI
jgi:hypothetical protein